MSSPQPMTAGGPSGQGPGPYVPPSAPPQARAPRGRGLPVVVIGLIALISAGIGGGIVAAVDHVVSHKTTAPATAPPPTAQEVQAANVRLCTLFATYNSAMPDAPKTAAEIMPQVYGLRLALEQTPNASSQIRDAIKALADSYDAAIAEIGKVLSRGYAQPPAYSVETSQAVYDRAWNACQLGS